MIGTLTPNCRSVSTILGTACAASSVLTVTRTSSDPARARSMIWLTVAEVSAVSVLVMDCTTIGWEPPTLTPPMLTVADFRRGRAGIYKIPPGIFSLVYWCTSNHSEGRLRRGFRAHPDLDCTEPLWRSESHKSSDCRADKHPRANLARKPLRLWVVGSKMSSLYLLAIRPKYVLLLFPQCVCRWLAQFRCLVALVHADA